jgi:hypothetical protein
MYRIDSSIAPYCYLLFLNLFIEILCYYHIDFQKLIVTTTSTIKITATITIICVYQIKDTKR